MTTAVACADLSTIRPLYALQLGPRRAQEADEARGAPPGGRAGRRRGDHLTALDGGGGDGLLLELLVEVLVVLDLAEGLAPGLGILLLAEGLAGIVRPRPDERGLELVDLAEVAQLARHVVGPAGSARSAGRGRDGAGPGFWALRALRCLARCRSRATGDRPR